MPADTNLDRAIYDLLSKQCPAMWLGFPIGVGTVYWVDTVGGLDTNVGTRPDLPFQSITHAIGQCVDDNNDYIMVLRATPASMAATETWPIDIDKVRIHIIGLPGSNNGFNGMYPKIASPGATSVFITGVTTAWDGSFSELAGLDLGAQAFPCVQMGDVEGFWVHDCWFGNKEKLGGVLPTYGIYNAGHAPKCRINHCKFLGSGGDADGGISVDGICSVAAAAAMHHTEIIDNIFQGCPNCGINLDWAIACVIKRNNIACDEDLQGAGITLDANSAGCLVSENRAAFGGAAMGANPYLDLAVNHWGDNWVGNALIYPA